MKRFRILIAAALLLVLLAGCASASGKKPPDGSYRIAVTLSGGTGRTSVASPAALRVEGGRMTATLVWSSPNYDYMLVDGTHYEPEIVDGHSVFEIPVAALDREIAVVADTVAMSVPHEIEYTLFFDSATLEAAEDGPEWSSLSVVGELPLRFATEFQVTEYSGGYQLIEINTTGRFLVVPEGAAVPNGLGADVVPLRQPLDCVYLAATSAMDFFRALDSIGAVRLSGTDRNGWYLPEARAAMDAGEMRFAGKYSAPDYELIWSESCDLAIESTMIYHRPEVKEQLEKLGLPVLVERSSYEAEPLGRMEWIKLYGVLLGKTDEAAALFDAETAAVEALSGAEATGRTVAFFYITSTGTANVRRSDDYVARMIELAGGEYVFSDLDSGSAMSTVNMTMEAFYDGAKDADLLIYNSSIDAELYTVDELLAKSPLLADFKAVRDGAVWCTGKNLFQEPMGLGKLIVEFHQVLTGNVPADGELDYLHRLT